MEDVGPGSALQKPKQTNKLKCRVFSALRAVREILVSISSGKTDGESQANSLRYSKLRQEESNSDQREDEDIECSHWDKNTTAATPTRPSTSHSTAETPTRPSTSHSTAETPTGPSAYSNSNPSSVHNMSWSYAITPSASESVRLGSLARPRTRPSTIADFNQLVVAEPAGQPDGAQSVGSAWSGGSSEAELGRWKQCQHQYSCEMRPDQSLMVETECYWPKSGNEPKIGNAAVFRDKLDDNQWSKSFTLASSVVPERRRKSVSNNNNRYSWGGHPGPARSRHCQESDSGRSSMSFWGGHPGPARSRPCQDSDSGRSSMSSWGGHPGPARSRPCDDSDSGRSSMTSFNQAKSSSETESSKSSVCSFIQTRSSIQSKASKDTGSECFWPTEGSSLWLEQSTQRDQSSDDVHKVNMYAEALAESAWSPVPPSGLHPSKKSETSKSSLFDESGLFSDSASEAMPECQHSYLDFNSNFDPVSGSGSSSWQPQTAEESRGGDHSVDVNLNKQVDQATMTEGLEDEDEDEDEDDEEAEVASTEFNGQFNNFNDLLPDDDDVTCNLCDRSFATPRDLWKHKVKKKHWSCEDCGEIFNSEIQLEYHKEDKGHWSTDCSLEDLANSGVLLEDLDRENIYGVYWEDTQYADIQLLMYG